MEHTEEDHPETHWVLERRDLSRQQGLQVTGSGVLIRGATRGHCDGLEKHQSCKHHDLWTVNVTLRGNKGLYECDRESQNKEIYLDKTIIQKDTCTPMFIAALVTIAKTWTQPKCP